MEQQSQEMEIIRRVSPAKLAQIQERLLGLSIDAHGRLILRIRPEERDPSWLKTLGIVHVREDGQSARYATILNLSLKRGEIYLVTNPCTITDLPNTYPAGTLFLYLNGTPQNIGQHPLDRLVH